VTRDWDPHSYDRVATPMTERGTELVERLELDGNEIVLDAGCGTGRVTERLRERLPHGRVVALDASDDMLTQARERLGDDRVTYVLADLGSHLPLEEPVDAIISTSTFHWVSDHAALYRHLAAVLKSGGTLTAEYGGHGNFADVFAIVDELGYDPRGRRYAEVGETLEWMELAGFEEARAELVPRPARTDDLREFLTTVTLAGYPDHVIDTVIERLDEPVLNYVRMVVSARRAHGTF
jgi:trans-aconitate 2-methyltransferase